MSILSKRSSFLGAILFIGAMLFANSAFAQVTPYWGIELWEVTAASVAGDADYEQFAPFCANPGDTNAGEDGLPCTPVAGEEVCLQAPASGCDTSDANGRVTFEDLAPGDYVACLSSTAWQVNSGSAANPKGTGNCVTRTVANLDDTTGAMYVELVQADLSITKVSNPVSVTVVAGTNLIYTITVTNNGPGDVGDAAVSDTFLAELGDCSFTSSAFGGASGNTADSGGTVAGIDEDPLDMPNGSSIEYTVTCAVPSDTVAGELLDNTATVTSAIDPDGSTGNNTDSVRTPVVRESAISITKTADPSPLVAQGGTQTYTIEVINGGPSDASNLFVTETLPAGLTVTAMNPPAICNGTSGTVICDVGTVAANDSFVFTLELAIPDNFGLGTITNIARVECTDAACSTNTTPEESAVQAEAQTRVVVAVPADGTALIAVQKFFTDGNDETPVTLTLACKTGSYVPASVTVNPDDFAPGSAFEQIFIVSNIPTGVPNPCTVVEEPVAGYDATYICGQDGSTSTVDDTLCNGFADFTPGTTACGWLDVATGASNLCGIFNNPAPVEVAVTKVWDVVSNTGGDSYSFDTEITIGCNAEILNSSWETGSWSYKQFFLTDGDYTDGMATVTVQVIPDYPSSECYAYESDVESAVEVTSDCGDGEDTGMEVSVGMGDSCTITNTLFFEGIPTLNQYGMALLALLMLGIGMVGFRRFA